MRTFDWNVWRYEALAIGMNARIISISILVAACVGALLVLMMQQRELANLRTRKMQLAAQALEPRRQDVSIIAGEQARTPSPTPTELLELRSKVTQMTQRRKDLEGVLHENEQLRIRLAVRGTNDFITLPPEYFRPSQAQWLGTDTPENSFQSFFWAIQQRGFTNFLELCTPHFTSDVKLPNDSPEDRDKFLEQLSKVLAIRIVNQRQVDSDIIRLHVEYLLRLPNSLSRDTDETSITFRRINGQWKQD